MAVTVRRAAPEDLPELLAWLARKGRGSVNLGESLVLVAEREGNIVGFIAAQHRIQVEPLLCQGPKALRRRASVMLGRAMERELRAMGIGEYFCVTRSTKAAALFAKWGMRRVYRGARMFRRGVEG